MAEKKLINYLYIFLAIALVLSVVNIGILQSRFYKVREAQAVIKELMKPANIEVIKILTDCNDCFDIEKAFSRIKGQNVNVIKEESLQSDSEEAKELIDKFNIQKLPTLIISGEINKTEGLNRFFTSVGKLGKDKLIYTALTAPYYDVLAAKVVGRVKVINIVDSLCADCTKLEMTDALKQSGVIVSEEKNIEFSSKEGQELIRKHGIKQIPAVLVSDDVDNYGEVKNALEQTNVEKKDGFYAVQSVVPPYISLTQNRLVGVITLVLLKDKSCGECYDVGVNKAILQRFGVVPKLENIYEVDVSSKEGQGYIKIYNINKIPIILISPDAKYYQSLANVWNNVGSIEKDGWFVMRKPEGLGIYKDLDKNEVVNPGAENGNDNSEGA